MQPTTQIRRSLVCAAMLLFAAGCSDSDSPTGNGTADQEPAVWHVEGQGSIYPNLELRQLGLSNHDLYAWVAYATSDSIELRMETKGAAWLMQPALASVNGMSFAEFSVADTAGLDFSGSHGTLHADDLLIVRTGAGNLFKLGNATASADPRSMEFDVQRLGTAGTRASMLFSTPEVSVPNGVSFSNESLDGTDYEWIVEGPEVANQSSDPSYLGLSLNRPGSYKVTLKVRNAGTGATDETSYDFGMLPPLAFRVSNVTVDSYRGDSWDGLIAANCPDIYVTLDGTPSDTKDGACTNYLPLVYEYYGDFPTHPPIFLTSGIMVLRVYDEDPGEDDLMASETFDRDRLTKDAYSTYDEFGWSYYNDLGLITGTIRVQWMDTD